MTEEMRTYLKRRSELEFQYCEEQSRLCVQFLQARKAAIKPATGKPGEENSKLLSKAWVSFLEETKTCARIRGQFSEKLRESFTTPMKPYLDDKRKSFTKQNEFLATKVQAELQTSFSELQAAKQIYEHCAREAEKAQQKYDEALKGPQGTISRFFTSRPTTEKLDQARKKLKASLRKQQEARNAYILKLESVNTHQSYYYTVALPNVMRIIDGSYFDMMRHNLTEFAELESRNFKEAMASMSQLSAAASKINRDLDYKEFVAENSAIFSKPRQFNLELYGNDKTSIIEMDEVSRIVMSNELVKLTERATSLDDSISKKDKEIEALRRLSKVYDNTPSFGRASDSLEEEETLQMAREVLLGEKTRVEAQVKMLLAAGVEVIKSATPMAKKPKKDNSTKQLFVSTAPATCVAYYDYVAQNPDELSFKANDVLVVIQTEGEWIKATLNGREGFVPANYMNMHANGGNGSDSNQQRNGPGRAQALYDFTGSAEDQELTFQAGDTIEIISRGTDDDPNFWEGRINGKTGFFPAMFVVDLDAEDDETRSETSTLDGRDGRKVSDQNHIDDLVVPATLPRTNSRLSVASTGATSLSSATMGKGSSTLFVSPPVLPPVSDKTFVIAQYDYDAQVDGELSFSAGERIEVINKDIGSPDWWEGVNAAGERGQFPTAYVQEEKPKVPSPGVSRRGTIVRIPAPPPKETVVAVYDFAAANSDELSFRAGDVIELLMTDVPGDMTKEWWQGKLNGRVGIFPRGYAKRTVVGGGGGS